MKLIIASPSPYARKVRVALHEKHIAFEETLDNPWNAGTVAIASNPLGQIPILMPDGEDGKVIFDSRVIIEYLETLPESPRLVPGNADGHVAARQIEALADGICDAVVLIVLETARPPELRSADWIARQHGKIDRGLNALAGLLADRQLFVGDVFSIADIAAGCTLGYIGLRLPDIAWRARYSNLAAFNDRMEARPSFAKTKPEAQPIAPVR